MLDVAYTPASVSSQSGHHILHVQQGSRNLPSLRIGEVLEAVVLDGGLHSTLILLKGQKVLSESSFEIKKGARIAVRVEQLRPNVVLRLVHAGPSEISEVGKYLRFCRAHPHGLSTILAEGSDLLTSERLGDLALYIGKDNIEKIQKFIFSLIISKESIKGDFFKKYIYNIGFLTEKKLAETVNKKLRKAIRAREATRNLKGLLMQISRKIENLPGESDLPETTRILRYIDSALQTIEAHQVRNAVLQERVGEYFFQIPVLLPGHMGTAEIFFKFGGKDSGQKDRREHQDVMIVLKMDALGEVAVRIKTAAKKIGCSIMCQEQSIAEFIQPLLSDLKDRMNEAGYQLEKISCVFVNDITDVKKKYQSLGILWDHERVDLLV